jgi:hypothetical protein
MIIQPEEKPTQGRRNVSRLRLYLPARVKTLEGEHACFVENISQTGARIIVTDSAKVGEIGTLRCGQVDILFDKVWSANGRTGLAFDELVPPDALRELRRVHDNFDEIQREEHRRIARDWVNGVIRDR